MNSNQARMTLPGYWGVVGFVALLTQAVLRLAPLARDAMSSGLTTTQWAICIGYTLFMVYSEGYKGFHRQASPRVVARALYLSHHPTFLRSVFAPLFCMGLFGATKKRLIISWAITVMIVALIIAVRLMSQPWRGIIDAGVVVGLAVGIGSTLYFLVRVSLGKSHNVDPEVSDSGS